MKKTQTGTYEQLGKWPGTLMGMVIRGEATVIGKDEHGRTIYKLEPKKRAR